MDHFSTLACSYVFMFMNVLPDGGNYIQGVSYRNTSTTYIILSSRVVDSYKCPGIQQSSRGTNPLIEIIAMHRWSYSYPSCWFLLPIKGPSKENLESMRVFNLWQDDSSQNVYHLTYSPLKMQEGITSYS